MKKCPPGVICVENVTLCMFFIGFIVFIWIFFVNSNPNPNPNTNTNTNKVIVKNHYEQKPLNPLTPLYPYSFESDVLRNPYAPPRYVMPINVSTNIGALDTTFRQVGILHPVKGNNKDNVLALMGRPVFTNRDMWQYYTIGNQLNHVKLPILTNQKNGLNEYGVNRLYSRDVIYVEGLNDAYRVTIYENDTLRYLPIG